MLGDAMTQATVPRILVVGRHQEILSRVTGVLETAGYRVFGTTADESALALMTSETPDALLLGGGVERASRQTLIACFHTARPGQPVIEHFGGPHRLLEHVREALGNP